MKRAIDERGPIAAWLIRARAQFREPNAARTWTVADFLKALEAETGWAPTRTTYARWESGATRPEPENLRRVEAFYAARGVGSIEEAAAVEPTPDPLIAALTAQTAAIAALVGELQQWRSEDRDRLAATERVVERLAGSLLPGSADGASPGRPARRQSAR